MPAALYPDHPRPACPCKPPRRFVRRYLTGFMLLLCGVSAAAGDWRDPDDPDWYLAKETPSRQTLTRSVEGSSVEAFQGRGVLAARLESVLAIFHDPEACRDWVHQCVVSRRHPGQEFRRAVVYGVNDFPWPADDRDYVLEAELDYEAGRQLAVIRYEVIESELEPANDDYIRIPMMSIRYQLRALSDRETEIIWVQHTDPGGLLPSWLLNMLLVDIPFESMERLEQLANQPRYARAELQLDEQGQPVGWSVRDW